MVGGGGCRWESLGGVLNFGPAVSSRNSGHLDVFARGTDNRIFQRSFSGGWTEWTSIGEPETTAAFPGIAAVSATPDQIYLVFWGSWDVGRLLTDKFYSGGVWQSPRKFADFGGAEAALNTLRSLWPHGRKTITTFLLGAPTTHCFGWPLSKVQCYTRQSSSGRWAVSLPQGRPRSRGRIIAVGST